MYLADVLELVCRKRRIPNQKEWALLLGDMSILVPLDRTVASLEGKKELVLYKKAWLAQLAYGLGRRPGRSADPNGARPFACFFSLHPVFFQHVFVRIFVSDFDLWFSCTTY